ncbi:DUF4394 domain-containing protein [Pseudoduganella albidiflava]|uniref:DUF4394 domain-containing protein n=1 Tax=Pseudoduganella albidiflava TaxID=321983 RepID=A0A411X4U4_9BURK|nr:DUF4394 domain-containing protein [Pseudoduganella albidiflava]QBI03898.1 DUF4394 domain-containing protein [Pseudoduganella albidiflava]GGY23098.1 hypothetical protein GCM10007387_00540 [Pseudoduganella albidiflava]
MNRPQFSTLALAISLAFGIAACGGGGNHNDTGTPMPTPTPGVPVVPGDVFALTASNKLISFNRDMPGTVRTTAMISGLQAGENLLGIDFRPADGKLYGVGSTGRLYTIDTASGAATLKATLMADAADTTAPFTALDGTDFGVDFNPVADRLRVVGNMGQSLRINVDTGATTTDGNINGGAATTQVTASAYTNSFAGTGTTTLYALDTVTDMLYIQNPPNNGTLATPVALGIDASAANGFDIDARTNMGYMVATVAGARNLYSINLAATSTPATLVAAVGGSEDIRGIALKPAQAPVIHGLTDDNRLVAFKVATPNTIDTTVAVSGLNGGETLLGIDIRPKDGMLYGITSAARIVTIDPATGVATVKATLMADTADTTAPYAAIAGTAFAVDFNPVADRLRVIGNMGQSLRINVDTGATTTDGAINRASGAAMVTAAAYNNSIAGATATILFDLDTATDVLAMQTPPNDGTLVDVGRLGVDAAGDVGMDIAGGANGLALAALRSSATGPSTLYRIDLMSGVATPVNGAATPAASVIGTGVPGLRDIAIAIK